MSHRRGMAPRQRTSSTRQRAPRASPQCSPPLGWLGAAATRQRVTAGLGFSRLPLRRPSLKRPSGNRNAFTRNTRQVTPPRRAASCSRRPAVRSRLGNSPSTAPTHPDCSASSIAQGTSSARWLRTMIKWSGRKPKTPRPGGYRSLRARHQSAGLWRGPQTRQQNGAEPLPGGAIGNDLVHARRRQASPKQRGIDFRHAEGQGRNMTGPGASPDPGANHLQSLNMDPQALENKAFRYPMPVAQIDDSGACCLLITHIAFAHTPLLAGSPVRFPCRHPHPRPIRMFMFCSIAGMAFKVNCPHGVPISGFVSRHDIECSCDSSTLCILTTKDGTEAGAWRSSSSATRARIAKRRSGSAGRLRSSASSICP